MDSGYIVCITHPTVLLRFFDVLTMSWICACSLNIILGLFLTILMQYELNSFPSICPKKVHVVWIYIFLRLYFVYLNN